MKTIFTTLLILISFHNTCAQYTNVRISNTSSNNPEEVSIAINPYNPLQLAAGANINYFYYSTNAGQSWTQGQLNSTFGVWGDPSLVFDSSGNLYFGHLSNPSSPGYWIDRIVVQKSTNGGVSYNNGVGVGFNPPLHAQDKEWLVADITRSPFRNNIYMSWTEFDDYGSSLPSDSSRILFSRSTDGGNSWSQPLRVSDDAGNCVDSDSTMEGAVPAVGPNGEIFIAWSGPQGIYFDKSTDGGISFGRDSFVTTQPGGWDYNVPGIYRCNGLPITACDISSSAHRGTIYINWTDQRNGENNTDVFLIKSTDSGNSWSAVKKVNTDTAARQQFLTWMTVDPITGYVYIVFYDRRNYNSSAVTTDVFVAKSMDGGATFSNFKVSQNSFTPNASVFFGDYINIVAFNKKIYPIWMRLDGNNLSVWTALLNDSAIVPVQEFVQQKNKFSLAYNYPNPFNPLTTIHYTLFTSALVSLKVYNILGQEVATLLNNEAMGEGMHEVQFDASGLPSGVYFYRMQAGEFSATKKLLLMK
jgi:hypothetical protein